MLPIGILTKARSLWTEGEALEAGKLIFDSLPRESRPEWAANILRLVLKRTGIKSPPIERVSSLARCSGDWNKAHEAFSMVRKAALKLEHLKPLTPPQTLLLRHLLLAELVAKVIYNATNPPDEFDEDSGWWIALCLKDILNSVSDEEFSAAMWLALSDPPHTSQDI